MTLYSIAVLGKPTRAQRSALEQHVQQAIDRFRLDPDDIEVVFEPREVRPGFPHLICSDLLRRQEVF